LDIVYRFGSIVSFDAIDFAYWKLFFLNS
jgi:hypothetical protein